MEEPIEYCPIWGEGFDVYGDYDPDTGVYSVCHSSRTSAGYRIMKDVLDAEVEPMVPPQKAKLTTWLIDQSERSNDIPTITSTRIEALTREPLLPIPTRADRLLHWLSSTSRSMLTTLGDYQGLQDQMDYMLAWSESVNENDVWYLVEYLEARGWLQCDPPRGRNSVTELRSWRVTVEGHTRVDELQKEERKVDSTQCFVAMWFNPEMDDAFEEGISPAVEEAGYKPLRIDRKEHVNKIDDEIIAEIRRSRFLVADFTHGDEGARGGVYYEAGFAHGLGIPVILTCRKDALKALHFDTRQYRHIVWKTPEGLYEDLLKCIRAIIY